MASADFRRIFEGLRLAMAVTGPSGLITAANAAFARLVGREARELPGAELASLFSAADQKRVQQNVSRVAEGKAPGAFFEAAIVRQGHEAATSVDLQPALDDRGAASAVVAVVQEVAGAHAGDGDPGLATARVLALAEASPAGVLIETAGGAVELANDAFCRMLALRAAPQSLAGMPVAEALGGSPVPEAGGLAAMRAEATSRVSITIALPDGRSAALERDPIAVEGMHAGAVWIVREESAAALGIESATAEVAVIEKIGEELAGALEGITALGTRVHQMELDHAMADFVGRIRASTRAAIAAIGELVDFSRVSGGVVLRKAPFALRPALADLIARAAPSAEERGCSLRVKVEQDVPDALEGDEERLRRVLRNLLENAFSLMPAARVTLQIRPEYTTHTGIQLSFAVLAESPPEQPMHAAPESGMGVALARYMVAARGGELTVGAGAGGEALYAFSIEFPQRAPAPAPPRPTHVSLVGMPVLVVSADVEQRHAVTALLRGWRMLPLEADNATMALALLERFHEEGSPVPLVIVANRLPGQDGFLLAFRIRHHPRLAQAIVMMLATEGRPGDAIACRENGIAAYMRYPVGERQLNEAIVAVTGAAVDADDTPTLVTRHSLREQRKGATVLLVDASRDSQILAAHILGRRDCSVVVAQDLAEAGAALEQDVYDLVLVDTALPGLDGPGGAQALRDRMGREAAATRLVATSLEHGPAFQKAMKALGFDATLAKPFRGDDLLALLAATRP
ncbi:MAG TPA: response regulator [Usitatibacter sp.]|nr:response regulator [Usitatibacter sp.]